MRDIKRNIFPAPWAWGLAALLIATVTTAVKFGHKFLIDPGHLGLLACLPFLALPAAIYLGIGDNARRLMARPLRLWMLICFLAPTMCALSMLDYLSMANGQPLVHEALARADKALGFDWVAYARFFGEHPLINAVVALAYDAMIPALVVVAASTLLLEQNRQTQELTMLVLITGIFTIISGSWFPAVSAMDYLGGDAIKALFLPSTGNSFMQEFWEVRGSIPKYVDPTHLAGITQFPSFHTVCGILIAYGARGVWWRFYPALLLSLLLLAATPVHGGHYLVDMLAGAAIAGASIAVSQGLHRRSPRPASSL